MNPTDEHRRKTRRYWVMVFLMLVAAIAASIAAWPILKEWLLQ